MSIRCPRCGHESADDDRYCPNCGTPLAADSPYDTGLLGMRAAAEGDSAPLPILDPTGGGLPAGTAVLLVLRGPSEGQRYQLDPGHPVVTVGRSPDADLFLDDVTVSRHHAELRSSGSGWVLHDVGSLNGTYVNRRRVDEQALTGGDEVQIGKYRFVFLAGPGPVA